VSKKLDQGAMEWHLFEKIIGELSSERFLSLVLFELHNEPLLDKRIFDWIRHVKSISPNKQCVIVTNGELLDKFSATEILQSNLDCLAVSLNAYSKEMYERVNTGLDYDRVVRNVTSLLSDPLLRPKMGVSFAVTGENVNEVQQAARYWKSQGVYTRVMGITNRAGSLDNYEETRFKGDSYGGSPFQKSWKRLTSRARGIVGCELPFYQMNILFNGDVILCCNDWNRATIVGNAGSSSLREIWNSEKMNEIRRLILRKGYEKIDSCKECSLAI
jgi:radical SAM protein with 4Fe4S-binding SPASM domain